MKWVNGLTDKEIHRRREQWHRWFAWFPVIVEITEDGHKVKIWLETVERRGRFIPGYNGGWLYVYQELKGK